MNETKNRLPQDWDVMMREALDDQAYVVKAKEVVGMWDGVKAEVNRVVWEAAEGVVRLVKGSNSGGIGEPEEGQTRALAQRMIRELPVSIRRIFWSDEQLGETLGEDPLVRVLGNLLQKFRVVKREGERWVIEPRARKGMIADERMAYLTHSFEVMVLAKGLFPEWREDEVKLMGLVAAGHDAKEEGLRLGDGEEKFERLSEDYYEGKTWLEGGLGLILDITSNLLTEMTWEEVERELGEVPVAPWSEEMIAKYDERFPTRAGKTRDWFHESLYEYGSLALQVEILCHELLERRSVEGWDYNPDQVVRAVVATELADRLASTKGLVEIQTKLLGESGADGDDGKELFRRKIFLTCARALNALEKLSFLGEEVMPGIGKAREVYGGVVQSELRKAAGKMGMAEEQFIDDFWRFYVGEFRPVQREIDNVLWPVVEGRVRREMMRVVGGVDRGDER